MNSETIVKQKIEHILFYTSDEISEWTLTNIAGDACYSSHNSIAYAKKKIADSLAAYDIAVEDKNDSEIASAERNLSQLSALLEIQTERHDVDLAVYKEISGGRQWMPYKKPAAPKKKANLDALRKAVS